MVDKELSKENDESMEHFKEESSINELLIKIKRNFIFLLSNWLIIALLGLIGGALGFIYAYYKVPIYTAVATFVLEDGEKGGGIGNLGGLASIAGIDIGGGGGLFQGDNIIELYKSRNMIEATLLKKGNFNDKDQLLIDRFVDYNKLKEKWKKVDWAKASFQDTSKFTILQDSILREVVKEINLKNLRVSKPDKKLSIIKVVMNSPDESFAKVFTDKIVETVNDFYIKTKTKRSTQNIKILQHKTDSVRAVMNGAIFAAASTSDETPNLNPTRQAQRVVPMQRSQFSLETNKAVLSALLQNLELSKVNLLKETPLIQVVDSPIYPLEVDKFGINKGIGLGGILMGIITVLVLLLKRNIN